MLWTGNVTFMFAFVDIFFSQGEHSKIPAQSLHALQHH